MMNALNTTELNTLFECPLKLNLLSERPSIQVNNFKTSLLDEVWINYFKSGLPSAKLFIEKLCILYTEILHVDQATLYGQLINILSNFNEAIFRGKLSVEVGKNKTLFSGFVDLLCIEEHNQNNLILFSARPLRIDSYETLGYIYLMEANYSKKVNSILYIEDILPSEGVIFKTIPVNEYWINLSKELIESSIELFNLSRKTLLPNLNSCLFCEFSNPSKGNCLWTKKK